MCRSSQVSNRPASSPDPLPRLSGQLFGVSMSQLGAGGYNPQHFAELDAVEENHFWFRARRKIVGSLVCQITATFPVGYYVLEVGCGNGSLLSTLQSACPGGRVIGMDSLLEGLRHARRRTDCLLVQGNAEQPPL